MKELKELPPTNLTVVDITAATGEDECKVGLKSNVPNTSASSSFISTSSESESE